MRRGLGEPAAARAFLAAGDAHPLAAWPGLARGRGADPRPRRAPLADHRARRLRRGRHLLDRDPRARAAHARRGRGLVPAEPDRRRLRARARDRRAAGRARDEAADHGRLRGDRGRGGRGRARARAWTSWSPTITPRARTACCRTRRSCTRASTATRARTCARRASRTSSRRRCWRARGRTRRSPTRTWTWSRWPRSPTSCRCRARTAGSCAQGLRALAGTRKVGLRALMDVARVDPSGLDEAAIGFRLGPRLNAAGRLYRADAGLELLLTEDRERAQGGRRGARPRQHRAPRRRDPDPLRGRGAGGRASRGQRARARRRGLAPGRDRDRRLADRRAPPPPGDPDRARRRGGQRLGPLDPGLRPARRPARRAPGTCCATAATRPRRA